MHTWIVSGTITSRLPEVIKRLQWLITTTCHLSSHTKLYRKPYIKSENNPAIAIELQFLMRTAFWEKELWHRVHYRFICMTGVHACVWQEYTLICDRSTYLYVTGVHTYVWQVYIPMSDRWDICHEWVSREALEMEAQAISHEYNKHLTVHVTSSFSDISQ